jgi:hypothetical protein
LHPGCLWHVCNLASNIHATLGNDHLAQNGLQQAALACKQSGAGGRPTTTSNSIGCWFIFAEICTVQYLIVTLLWHVMSHLPGQDFPERLLIAYRCMTHWLHTQMCSPLPTRPTTATTSPGFTEK